MVYLSLFYLELLLKFYKNEKNNNFARYFFVQMRLRKVNFDDGKSTKSWFSLGIF